MKIGDEVYVHGYIDEIRQNTVIIRNDGGYFGTVPSEVIEQQETLQNLIKPNKSDLIVKGAGEIKDGLYNIKDGKLFKYKANGGTVRTYPIVSADRPKGHWIDTEAQDYIEVKHRTCSVCRREPAAWSNHKKFKYCPNCGARMESDTE